MILLTKVKSFVMNQWKAIVFSILYLVCFFMLIAMSFEINASIKGGDYAIFSPLFLSMSLLALLSIAMSYCLKFFLKERADEILRKSSWVIMISGMLFTIVLISSILSSTGIPIDDSSEFGKMLSLFIVPLYFVILIMMGLFSFAVTLIAFVLLRLSQKHIKFVVAILIISSILWFVSLGNIYVPKNISVGKINNPQVTYQDILSMGDYSENYVNTFFMHDNKMYAYIYGKNPYNDGGDEFFVVDQNGKNKKVISNSEQLRFAQFIYIEEDEAYYYTMYTNSINAINLETGEITKVMDVELNGGFAVTYSEAKQQFFTQNPEFESKQKVNYQIEDDYYGASYYDPRAITVRTIKTNETNIYQNVIHWNIDGTTLYLLCGEKKSNDLYYSGNIKGIYIKKINI